MKDVLLNSFGCFISLKQPYIENKTERKYFAYRKRNKQGCSSVALKSRALKADVSIQKILITVKF